MWYEATACTIPSYAKWLNDLSLTPPTSSTTPTLNALAWACDASPLADAGATMAADKRLTAPIRARTRFIYLSSDLSVKCQTALLAV